jgi:hypothetical protein
MAPCAATARAEDPAPEMLTDRMSAPSRSPSGTGPSADTCPSIRNHNARDCAICHDERAAPAPTKGNASAICDVIAAKCDHCWHQFIC